MEAITIRMMSDSDLEKVADLSKQLGYALTLEELSTHFKKISANKDHLLRVAVDDADRVVGYLHARVVDSLVNGSRMELAALVVDEAKRGRGVGKLLVASFENWCKERGNTNLFVRSNVKRDKAHQFYLALGYEIKKTSHTFELMTETG